MSMFVATVKGEKLFGHSKEELAMIVLEKIGCHEQSGFSFDNKGVLHRYLDKTSYCVVFDYEKEIWNVMYCGVTIATFHNFEMAKEYVCKDYIKSIS